jgi:hypothetical protein
VPALPPAGGPFVATPSQLVPLLNSSHPAARLKDDRSEYCARSARVDPDVPWCVKFSCGKPPRHILAREGPLPWACICLVLRAEVRGDAPHILCPKGASTDQRKATPWGITAKSMYRSLKSATKDTPRASIPRKKPHPSDLQHQGPRPLSFSENPRRALCIQSRHSRGVAKPGPADRRGRGPFARLVLSLSKNHAMAKVIEELKKGSSKWLKTQGPEFRGFHWQAGYGACSVSQSQVEQVRHSQPLSFPDR